MQFLQSSPDVIIVSLKIIIILVRTSETNDLRYTSAVVCKRRSICSEAYRTCHDICEHQHRTMNAHMVCGARMV